MNLHRAGLRGQTSGRWDVRAGEPSSTGRARSAGRRTHAVATRGDVDEQRLGHERVLPPGGKLDAVQFEPASLAFREGSPVRVGRRETDGPRATSAALPDRLLAIRRHLGLTQAELAARLGQDEGQICRWERGRLKPQPWIAGRPDLELKSLEGRPVESSPTQSFADLTRWRRNPPTAAAVLPTSFGERLRARRLRLGLSMEELGRRIGGNRGTIYRLERGNQAPSIKLRLELDQAFATIETGASVGLSGVQDLSDQ